MAISELWMPETIVCFFLVLPLFRPFFKALWPMDGLVWLPVAAMVITAGIFPAYGFRPECLPVLLFAFIYNAANLGSLFSSIRSQPSDAFRDRGVALTVLAFIVLGAAVFTMYAFSPRIGEYPETETEPARLVKVPGFSRDYCLQIYGPFRSGRPVIFLVPPDIGSSASVEFICAGLEKKGYTVVTYSRSDFDFVFTDENGRKRFSLPAKVPWYLYAYLRGTRFASANNRGKAMEAERKADIEFLLPRIYGLIDKENKNVEATGRATKGAMPPFVLAGYGAGGSALAYMNADGGFPDDNVLGIVAVESRLWSSYLTEPADASGDSSAGDSVYLIDRVMDALPKTLNREKELPRAVLPVMYLVSGGAFEHPRYDYGSGKNPYQAVFDTQRLASGPIAIVAIADAGPLDYQDFPLTHPVYSFVFPWLKDAAGAVSDTAGIIGNFASALIEQSAPEAAPPAGATPDGEPPDDAPPAEPSAGTPPPRSQISGSLYVESKGMDWFK